MNTHSFNQHEIAKLVEEVRIIKREISATRTLLTEIEEALRLLDRIGWDRKFFRLLAGFLIEVPPSEARKYLVETKEVLEARLNSLEREERELREKLSRALKGGLIIR